MKPIGLILLAGVGYYAYTHRAQLFGGVRPVYAPTPMPQPINTPQGTVVPIGGGGAPPGMTLPTVCPDSSQQLLERATSWIHGNDRSQSSLLGLIRNTAKPCRPQLGTALKMVGVSIPVVDAALRAVG